MHRSRSQLDAGASSDKRSAVFRLTTGWPWAIVLAAAADLAALKAGFLAHSPVILAGLFFAALAALAARLLGLTLALVSHSGRPARKAPEILTAIGALVALAGGSANWLLSLQGFAILHEGESVRLREGAQLQEFEAGPLAHIDEMDVVVTLDELDLVPRGDGRFDPASRLRIWHSHVRVDTLQVTPRESGESGPLRFHQGAFGFAPRITIVHRESPAEPARQVFDEIVPFVTERRGPDGLSFDGRFEITAEKLKVAGHVDLASLDEGLRGHATLWLDVSREGESLGGGPLLPGHFAEIDRGYRIGFTDLQRWSEIVISRRNYGRFVAIGTATALLGGLAWFAVFVGRTRPLAFRSGRARRSRPAYDRRDEEP